MAILNKFSGGKIEVLSEMKQKKVWEVEKTANIVPLSPSPESQMKWRNMTKH